MSESSQGNNKGLSIVCRAGEACPPGDVLHGMGLPGGSHHASLAKDSLLLQVLGSTLGHELCVPARYVNNRKCQGHGGPIKLQGQGNRLWLILSVVTAVSSVSVHPTITIIYLKYLNSGGVRNEGGRKTKMKLGFNSCFVPFEAFVNTLWMMDSSANMTFPRKSVHFAAVMNRDL